jgi:hypothetical protein
MTIIINSVDFYHRLRLEMPVTLYQQKRYGYGIQHEHLRHFS